MLHKNTEALSFGLGALPHPKGYGIQQWRFTKKNYFLLLATAISGLVLCAPQTVIYSENSGYQLSDSRKSVLCLPLKKIHVEYIDNTRQKPEVQYPDSFFINAANELLIFETSQNFNVVKPEIDTEGSIIKSELPGYSLLAHDTVNKDSNAKLISKIAETKGANLIVVPYACVLKQYSAQGKGWRGNSGPGYEKPVSYKATTLFHVQIWNKNGCLLYERISRTDKTRPVLYSLLKKEKTETDIVLFAKKMYAPPMLKALYSAIKLSMRFKT
jgi:hypothetical protein